MSVIFLLLPLALLLAAVFVAVFVWAAHAGQFDDLETPSHRMLHDDEPPTAKQHAPSRNGGEDDQETAVPRG